MKNKVVVTQHAIERARERLSGFDLMRYRTVRNRLVIMYENGIPFGRQKGRGFMLLASHENTEVVLAGTVDDNGENVIKTILSKDHAIANMETWKGLC